MKKYSVLILSIAIILVVIFILMKNKPTEIKNQTVDFNLQNNQQTNVNNQQPATTKEQVSQNGTFAVDLQNSSLVWEGKKTLIKEWIDSGNINLKTGSVESKDGQIISGNFSFDMTSISAEKTGKGSGESGLTKHLKSADFFDVEQYPTGEFKITEVVKNEADQSGLIFSVTGDLTIKGVTNSVNFPAEIYQADGKLFANAIVSLDRTKWNIRYGSDKFFDNLGNNIIDDIFTLTFAIVTE